MDDDHTDVTNTDPGAAGPARPRVLVVSDVRIVRDGLLGAVRDRQADWDVTSCASFDHALAGHLATGFDVVLLDMSMVGALEYAERVARLPRASRIVAFAVTESNSTLLACVERGIVGFVPREGSVADVIATIEGALGGEARLSPRLTATLMRRLATLGATREAQHAASLTRREHEILALIDEGLSNKEIAVRLLIELATVKNHVHSILEKTRSHRRGEAAARVRGVRRS